MPDSREQIKAQLAELADAGTRLRLLRSVQAEPSRAKSVKLKPEFKKEAEALDFSARYHEWYSTALRTVEQIMPDRYAEFRELYKLDRAAKELDPTTYTISDYIRGLVPTRGGTPVFNVSSVVDNKVAEQINILRSAIPRLDSLLGDIKGVLAADVFDDELAAASELLAKKHLRAAGVVAGVVLERHLKQVAQQHGVMPRKKNPTISDLNDALKTAGVYDTPPWRQIQRLGDIRNLAGHDKERDPTADEISELIDGTDKTIKTLF